VTDPNLPASSNEAEQRAARVMIHYHVATALLEVGQWRAAYEYLSEVSRTEGDEQARSVYLMVALARRMPVNLDEYDG
jgi:hypothetical protein